MPRSVLLLAVVLLLVAVAPAAPVPKRKTAGAEYFPTAIGTKRVYQQNGKRIMTEEIMKAEEKEGEVIVTVRVSERGADDQTYAVTKDGVIWRTEGPFKLDLSILRFPLKEGDSWEFEMPVQRGLMAESGTCVVGKVETVEVPAGKYEAIPIVTTVKAVNEKPVGKAVVYTHWYAPQVGLVKITHPDAERVLEEFTPSGK